MKNPTKQTQKPQPKHRGLRILGGIVLIASLLFCVWLMGGAVAYGWISHADHYGAAFAAYGKWYYVSAGCMTAAVILYYCRQDLCAAILDVLAYVPMLVLMLTAMNRAETNDWVGQTEASFGRSAAQVWRNGMMWNALPFALLLILALTRYFSYDAAVRRREKRAEKERKLNMAAPSILGDETARQDAPKKS